MPSSQPWPAPRSAAFNERMIAEYRAHHGMIGGPYAGAQILLLHTLGAHTRLPRLHPMTYRKEGNTYYVFASYAGNAHHPAWYHNLRRHPHVQIEVDDLLLDVTATPVLGPERAEIYDRHASTYPLFADYARMTSRVIPVVALRIR